MAVRNGRMRGRGSGGDKTGTQRSVSDGCCLPSHGTSGALKEQRHQAASEFFCASFLLLKGLGYAARRHYVRGQESLVWLLWEERFLAAIGLEDRESRR